MKYTHICETLPQHLIKERAVEEQAILIKSRSYYTFSQIFYDKELIGYRFYIKGFIFDVSIDMVNKMGDFINHYEIFISHYKFNKINVNTTLHYLDDRIHSVYLSAVERYTNVYGYEKSYEITTTEQLKYIVRLLHSGYELNLAYFLLLSDEKDTEESRLLKLLANTPINTNISEGETIIIESVVNDSNFDKSIPLDDENVNHFIIHLFKRIEYHLSLGKNKQESYELVLEEMNVPNTRFNYLMQKFNKQRGHNKVRIKKGKDITPITSHLIKDYYTRRYKIENGKVFRKEK